MLEAYVVILCNSYSMNKVATGGWSPWKWVWPARLRRLAVRWALRPGHRLRSRLVRFAAVSRQGAPCSKSTRLPDPAASSHQFLHGRSEYKVLKVYLRHNYDSTWRAIRACANAVTTYLATLYHSYYSPRSRGKERLDTLLRHTTMDNREFGWQTRLVPKPRWRKILRGAQPPCFQRWGGLQPPAPPPASYAGVYMLWNLKGRSVLVVDPS